MRRVVITGLGLVTPLACGVEASWDALLSGASGARAIDDFDASDLTAKIACPVPRADHPHPFVPADWLHPKEHKKVDPFILYGIAAARQAIDDAGWKPEEVEALERTGVLIGSGIGGLSRIADNTRILDGRGPRRISPFFVPGSLINLIAGYVSILHGFRGPNHAVVTACATGAHAIGDAARMIMLDDADVMVAGSAESAITRLGIAGFAAARALSTSFNDEPTRASRPWDRDRDGFVMGDGAGVVVLEEYEHAKNRGATIYAEVTGYGMSGDAHHITAPAEDGRGAILAMTRALKRAGINPDEIDYINAHGTSTPLGDMVEHRAVCAVLGDHAKKVMMSSTKSAIGHLLGAAGSVESVFCALAIKRGVVPPTLNLDNPDEGVIIDLVPHQARESVVNTALCNSFGFGGTNASLVFKAV